MRVWIAIWVGSTIISRHIGAWLARGVLLRLTLLLLAAGFIKGLPVTTALAWLGAAAWVTAAIVLGLRAPDPTAAPKPKTGEPRQPAEEAPLTAGQLATALHQVGSPHAHISALAEHLQTSTDAVRQALDEARIPVSGGVRMKGRKVAVSPGVKAGDFPPLPSPSQEPGQGAPVEGPLTSNNNSNNNNSGAAQIVQDEQNPHRWRVLRRA